MSRLIEGCQYSLIGILACAQRNSGGQPAMEVQASWRTDLQVALRHSVQLRKSLPAQVSPEQVAQSKLGRPDDQHIWVHQVVSHELQRCCQHSGQAAA